MEVANSLIPIKPELYPSPKNSILLNSSYSFSPSYIQNEKLKLSFEKHTIHNQITKINNRINKILAIEKLAAKKSFLERQNLEETKKKM